MFANLNGQLPCIKADEVGPRKLANHNGLVLGELFFMKYLGINNLKTNVATLFGLSLGPN